MPDLSGGNAFVDVMPSMRGYFQRVRREIQSNPVEHEIQPSVDQRQLEKARQQVEQASAKVEAARRKEADATGAVAVAEAKLQALVDRGVTDAGRLATARENVAKATRRQEAAAQALQAAESGQRSAEGRVLRVQARLDSAEAETQTDSFFQRMTGRARAFGGGFSGILKGAATGAVAAVGLLSTQMGEVLERGNLQRSLRAQLDLTAEESKRAGSIAGNVFAQNYGSSMAEVTDAVGAVAGSISLIGDTTDAEMEDLTKRLLVMAQTFGMDVNELAMSSSLLMRNGIAQNGQEATDMLMAAFQRVPPAMRGELMPIVDEYGGYLTGLGFTGQEAMGLIVNASQNGAIGMDKMGDALKEFQIRATDMSKTSGEAYTALGMDQTAMTNRLLAGGEDAKAAFREIMAGLEGIKDPAARSQAALALFGTPLEDLGVDKIPQFLAQLNGADSAMGDFQGSVNEAGDVLAGGPLNAIQTFGREMQNKVVGLLGDNVLPMFGEFTGALEDSEGNALAAAASMVGLGGALGGFEQAKGVFDSVKEGVVGVKDSLVSAKDTATQAWSTMKDAGGWVKTQATAVGSFVKTSASATVEAVKTAASWTAAQARIIGGWIANAARATATFIATSASAALEAGKTAISWVVANARIVASFIATRAAMIASAVATGAMTAAQWLLNAALNANPIGVIIVALLALVGAIVWAWNNVDWFRNAVLTAWDWIQAAISWAWNNVIMPILNWFGQLFSALGAGIMWVWNNVIKVAWDLLLAGLQAVGNYFSWVWNSVIKPVWDALGAGIAWVVDNVVLPVWDRLKGALDLVKDAFGAAVDWIGQVWDRIKGIAAKPVKFVVDTVYNKGIREAWNKVAGWLNLPKLDEAPLGELGNYARGTSRLPGYSPGHDNMRFVSTDGRAAINLGGGEGIARPEVVRAVGPSRWDNLNTAARTGGVPAVRRELGNFAGGGVVESIVDKVNRFFPGMEITSTYRDTNDLHGRGLAVDFSNGGTAGTPQMKAAARFFHDNYAPMLAELIHWPLAGWRNIDEGRPFDFGPATNDQHRDHVHVAAYTPLPEPGTPIAPIASGGSGGGLFGWLRARVADAFEGVMNPIGNAIPDFGGGDIGKLPKLAFDKFTSTVGDFLRGKADKEEAAAGIGAYGAGADFYASEIIRAAKDRGLGKEGASIGIATALVESALRMYANPNVPESLSFPHDALGYDHDSVGLFQQRQAGWGTIQERMNPYGSAGLFFNAMVRKFPNWRAMDPGAVAQGVQVSAFPDRYGQRMPEARAWVDRLFDQGGLAHGRGIMMKDIIRPERVLDADMTRSFDEKLIPILERLTTVSPGEVLSATDRAALVSVDLSGAQVVGQQIENQYVSDDKRVAREVRQQTKRAFAEARM